MPRKSPYTHLDGSNCWTKNCSRRAMKYSLPSFYKPESFPVNQQLPLGAWSDEDTVLFKTPHGSKLYGMAHDNSDDDWYIVTPSPFVARQERARQRILGNEDVLTVPFKTFVRMAEEGIPQALETMFSRLSVSPYFEDFRNNFYASDPRVIDRYIRTMKSFAGSEDDPKLSPKDVFKRKRHALRLALNLDELMHTGRFNPTLKLHQVERISELASKRGSAYRKELFAISPVQFEFANSSLSNG